MPRFAGRPRTLRGRLILWHAIAVVGVLLTLGVVLDQVLERYFVEQLTDSLITDARAVQQALPAVEPLQEAIVRSGRTMGVRITIIRTDGVVLADSEHDPATMENHRGRPEVQQALSGRVGEDSRTSATIGTPFRYVALPPEMGRIVRVALPLTAVHSRLRTVRAILAAGFGAAAVAGILVLAAVARSVSRPLRSIVDSLEPLGEGNFEGPVPEAGTDELALLAGTLNRMRAELASRMEAMEEDRSTRDAILSSLDEGVVLFGSDGVALYGNPSAAGLLGGPVTHVRSLTPSSLQRMVGVAAEGSRPPPVEVSEGAMPRTVLAAAAAVGEGNVLLVLRDVTEHRRLEAMRRDFVANASHELKTPVSSIQALAETIGAAAGDDPAAVPRFAGQLEREAQRLGRMIRDLLDLSRLEGEPAGRTEVRFDLLVVEEAEMHRGRAEAGGLSLSVNVGEDALQVRGSARDLRLMVRNLVENAVQYTRPGGGVEVSARSDGDHALLEVRDTGVGIPAKDRPRVFERFYRVDRARSRETGGTGLGLSIVKHVAESHGGTVAVESALGEGSRFLVRLPLAG